MRWRLHNKQVWRFYGDHWHPFGIKMLFKKLLKLSEAIS